MREPFQWTDWDTAILKKDTNRSHDFKQATPCTQERNENIPWAELYAAKWSILPLQVKKTGEQSRQVLLGLVSKS